MTIVRRLYAFLIGLHPERFRRRFGEEMLSTFEEATRASFGIALIFDAFVSILRQRIGRNSAFLVWMLSVLPLHLLVSTLVRPATRTLEGELFYTVLPVFVFFAICGNLMRSDATEYMGSVMIWTTLGWLAGPGTFLMFGVIPTMLIFHSWIVVNLLVFGIQTATFFIFVKSANERAVRPVR